MKGIPRLVQFSAMSTLILLIAYGCLSIFEWHNPTVDTVIGILFGLLFVFNLIIFIRQIRNNRE